MSTPKSELGLGLGLDLGLTLTAVNADVYSVHQANGERVGNLKRIGNVWKFKAVGYGATGGVEPGGGPLTDQHNLVLAAPDAKALNTLLAGCISAATRSALR